MIDLDRLSETLANARAHLLAQRGAHGHWEGRLSSSALSTATAVCALRDYAESTACPPGDADRLRPLIGDGLHWLAAHQNADGGWGDTTLSVSNISTTALCWAAFAPTAPECETTVRDCEAWLATHAGGLDPPTLATAIRRRYGKDHTFSVPILTALALSGRLGDPQSAWRLVPQLPFELAACPHQWFAALRMPVVSYALPALIAIGQVRHHARATRNPILRGIRNAVRRRTRTLLRDIQPTSGGFLEATPLTSFVVMSLVGAGGADHSVVSHGVDFLMKSARPDGSWAIDSDLATWVTTLSVLALDIAPGGLPTLTSDDQRSLRDWLLSQQFSEEHPYTHAAPGGWAWTDKPGGVPDADDTPGALLALNILDKESDEVGDRAEAAVTWLLDLQNGDGGIPTFCRGWGALPFDQSSADLTAHALRAWRAWDRRVSRPLQARIATARHRALAFLQHHQRDDGAWTPLWFGNQHAADEANPTYGTSRVLLALADEYAAGQGGLVGPIQRGGKWLLSVQNGDGGWGGADGCPSSIEETSLAVCAVARLVTCQCLESGNIAPPIVSKERLLEGLKCGTSFLIDRTTGGTCFPPTPIGFYFAKLWYYEELYPAIFSARALGEALTCLSAFGVERRSPTEVVP